MTFPPIWWFIYGTTLFGVYCQKAVDIFYLSPDPHMKCNLNAFGFVDNECRWTNVLQQFSS